MGKKTSRQIEEEKQLLNRTDTSAYENPRAIHLTRNLFPVSLVATVLVHAFAVVCLVVLRPINYGELYTTVENAFGIGFYLVCVGLGPLTLGLCLQQLSQSKLSPAVLAIVAVLLGIGCFAAVAWSFASLLQVDLTYSISGPDSLFQFFGCFVAIMYPVLGAVCFYLAGSFLRRLYPRQRLPTSISARPHGKQARLLQPTSISVNILWILGAVALYVILFCAVSILAPLWNSSPGYFATSSPYDLTDGFYIALGQNRTGDDANNYYDPIIVPKVYTDVVIYFGVMLFIIYAGAVATYTSSIRRTFHRRVLVRALPAYFDDWSRGFCIGELLLLVPVLGLYAAWFWYWGFQYARIPLATEAQADPSPKVQNWARVMGHITTLTMSFLLLPATRNSVWESVFGIPFERIVKYHRVLGRITWLSVTTHMVMFQYHWLSQGLLWNNVFALNSLIVNSGGNPNAAHLDNFTIPLVEAAWLILTIALIFAQFSRRWSYELFHYTHHAVWVFFLAALIHAWSHWYYVAGGLLLYFFDKLSRLAKGAEKARVVSMVHHAGVTRLEIVQSSLSRRHYAGQYAFVNLPGLAPYQWHPYTISSAPVGLNLNLAAAANGGAKADASDFANERLTFHIKDMGPGTWSHDVNMLAQSIEAGKAVSGKPVRLDDVAVSVDGTYGSMGHVDEKTSLLMIAGGIGITPFHSLFKCLYQRASRPDIFGAPPAPLRRVRLVWILREPSMLAIFADTLAEIMRTPQPANSDIRFTVEVYCTTGNRELLSTNPVSPSPFSPSLMDAENHALVVANTRIGRPHLRQIFAAVIKEAEADDSSHALYDRMSAMVCGPSTLINDVSLEAHRHRTDFHSEVFYY